MSQFARQSTNSRGNKAARPADLIAAQRRSAERGSGGLAGPAPVGNQAIQRALREAGVQTKMTVNEPHDQFEQEADRVADQVMRMPDSAIQRQAAGEEEEETLQTKPLANQITPLVQRQAAGEEEEELQTKLVPGAPTPLLQRQEEEEEEVQAKRLPGSPTPLLQRQEEEEEELQAKRVPGVSAPQLQRQGAEEEEEELQAKRLPGANAHVQRQAEPEEEEETLQTKSRDSLTTGALQRQAEPEEEEETVQTRRESANTPTVSPQLEATLNASRGGGSALDTGAREFLEPRMGRDFSNARVHTDSKAADSAQQLNAQAFTRGQDIYFGAGRYQPHTEGGRRLLAHELTHTVQQQPSPAQPAVQRQEDGTSNVPATPPAVPQQAAVDPTALPLADGRLDPATETITFDQVEVPGFKLESHRGGLYSRRLRQQKNFTRGNTAQRDIWKREVGVGTVPDLLAQKVRTARGVPTVNASDPQLFKAPSKFGNNPPRYLIGDLTTVARELTLPSWGSDNAPKSFDVDHILELQLAGWPADSFGNTLANMELLESSANQSSGSAIKGNIDQKVNRFIQATSGTLGRNVAGIKGNYHLEFNSAVAGGGSTASVGAADYWTRSQIEAGAHLSAVEVADSSELGNEEQVRIFPDGAGGVAKQFVWPGALNSDERNWLKPYVITSKNFNTAEGAETQADFGNLTFNIPENDPQWSPFQDGDATITVSRIPGARFAGFVVKQSLRDKLRGLRHKRFSPIEVHEFDLDPEAGIVATGQILPDAPLIGNAGLEFEVRGNNITIFKEFSTGDFQVPAPFEVIDSSLVLSIGTEAGAGITGRVEFGVQNVGDGFLQASATTSGGFDLEGGFNFDSNLFQPAQVKMTYIDDVFGVEGELGIPPGKVAGIRAATVNVSYSEGVLSANGTGQLDVPGIEEGTLAFRYADGEGFSIGGSFNLSSDIPGIRGGSVEAEVTQSGDEGYSVTARGTAAPDIPGVDASISVTYADGALTVEGSVGYERGPVAGTITVGATNLPVDEEGNPAGEPGKTLSAYGGGTVTATITPWLQGTIGLKILRSGQVEVSGTIGLPNAIDLFPEKALDKNIFSIGIDIPIVGVSVAGQRIGIFANISGGLDLSAGIGPGQLRELGLTVTFNPDQPEATTITGGAQLHVPAHAGLRLFVRGSLGAGIPVVSAQAGLEIGGELGVEGALQAAVDVNWTPNTGLAIDAEAEIFAQPAFRFDITGFVLVEADLLFTTIELYSKRWELASFEFGSGLRFGMKLPIHYQEGQAFDINLSDIEFEVPDIDPKQLLSGLIDRIG